MALYCTDVRPRHRCPWYPLPKYDVTLVKFTLNLVVDTVKAIVIGFTVQFRECLVAKIIRYVIFVSGSHDVFLSFIFTYFDNRSRYLVFILLFFTLVFLFLLL